MIRENYAHLSQRLEELEEKMLSFPDFNLVKKVRLLEEKYQKFSSKNTSLFF